MPQMAVESVAALVAKLQKSGITLFRDGENVRYRHAAAGPDEEIVKQLSTRKDELFAFFIARERATLPPLTRAAIAVPSVTQEIWWNWIDKTVSLTLNLIEFIRDSSPEQVAQAIHALVSEHDSLRSRFWEHGGQLRVAHNGGEDFQVEHQTLSAADGVGGLKACVDAFVARPLPADAAWLLRAKVIVLPGYGQAAVLVANHMIVDGTSMDILRRGLRQRTGHSVPQAKAGPRFTYADFAAWQRSYLEQAGPALADYWRLWMKGRPELVSPVGKRTLRWQPGRKVRRSFVIPAFAQGALNRFAADHATFPFLVYATLLALAVSRWCGAPEFVLRTLCDARTLPQFAGMVGLMTGADTIHVHLDPGASFLGNLRRMEREYFASIKLRLPNIYAVPPFSVGPKVAAQDQAHNVGVVLNYRKIANPAQATLSGGELSWPPPEASPRHDEWPHVVSPICLEVTQAGSIATAGFLLHEDLLSKEEQDRLIGIFFEIFQKTLGPWGGGDREIL